MIKWLLTPPVTRGECFLKVLVAFVIGAIPGGVLVFLVLPR